MTLSDTQRLVLGMAAQHEARLAAAPTGLLAAARNAVFRSLLKKALLAECAAPHEHAGLAWRQDADGTGVALRITDAGLRAIGGDSAEGAAAVDAASAAAHHRGPAPPDASGTDAALGVPAAPGRGTRAMAGADVEDEGDPRHAAADAEPAGLPGRRPGACARR